MCLLKINIVFILIVAFAGCQKASDQTLSINLDFQHHQESSFRTRLIEANVDQRTTCDEDQICVSVGYSPTITEDTTLTKALLLEFVGIEQDPLNDSHIILHKDLIIEVPQVDLGSQTILDTNGHDLSVVAESFVVGEIITGTSETSPPGNVTIITGSLDIQVINTNALNQVCLETIPSNHENLEQISDSQAVIQLGQESTELWWFDLLGRCDQSIGFYYQLDQGEAHFLATYDPELTQPCPITFQIDWERYDLYRSQFEGRTNTHAYSGGTVLIVKKDEDQSSNTHISTDGSGSGGVCEGYSIFGINDAELFAQITISERIRILPRPMSDSSTFEQEYWTLHEIQTLEDSNVQIEYLDPMPILRPISIVNLENAAPYLRGQSRTFLNAGNSGEINIHTLNDFEWNEKVPDILKGKELFYP